jgi:hypothetical protein
VSKSSIVKKAAGSKSAETCALQGHRGLANKKKAVTQADLMEHGSGGLNGLIPPDPQSIGFGIHLIN